MRNILIVVLSVLVWFAYERGAYDGMIQGAHRVEMLYQTAQHGVQEFGEAVR